jgi:solute carrier family 25 citrate transporter 1
MMRFGSVITSILAGALTGLAETLLMYPLENIKTQQQLRPGSMLATIRRTLSVDGVAGLYRGIGPILIGAIPTQALRWGTIEFVCSTSANSCSTLNEKIVAGMISGIVVAIIVGVPIETLKTEMIHSQQLVPVMSPCETPNVAASVQDLFELRTADPSSSPSLCRCKGWVPTVLKKVLNQSIRFPAFSVAFDLLCFLFVPHGATVHPALTFVAGAMSGMSSVLVTQPIDVVKTRMQGLTAHRYRGAVNCLSTVTREEGWVVLFEGMWARVLRSSMGAGVTFTLFPFAQKLVSFLIQRE